MEIVLTIYRIISNLTLVYGAYYAILGVLGLLLYKKRVKPLEKKDKENYFAIIVPARNEENVVGNLIDSLNNMNYPKNKYAIYVMVNNTTDNTLEVAKEHGANAIDCKTVIKTKADVLTYAFNYLRSSDVIDAYVIFDADNVVHPDFLSHMNDVLNNGYRVASSFRDAKNPSDSWVSSSYAVFYYIQSLFLCRSRLALNANSTITGTGFMVKKEIIDKDGFNTYTLTEDMEFAGQCSLKKERIYYCEDAITYDEYPTDFKTSWKQRERWSVGNIQCMKMYFGKLFKNFLRTGRIDNIDMAFNYCAVTSQVVVYLNLYVFRIANFICGNPLIEQDYVGWVIRVLIQMALPLITVLMLHKKVKSVWKGIVLFPLFIISWLPLNAICLFKKDVEWKEIKHDRSIKLEEIG